MLAKTDRGASRMALQVSESGVSGAAPRWPALKRLTANPIAWCALATALLFLLPDSGPSALANWLGDTDDAVRLVTVRELLGGPPWFDTTLPRIGAPEPLVSHWSRLIDAPLALLMLLFRPLFGVGGAEIATRMAWPAVLFFILQLMISKEALRRAGPWAAAFAVALPLLSLMPLVQFKPGRIDHHNAQILCAVAGLMYLVRSLEEERVGWIAGALIGLGLAVGYEAIGPGGSYIGGLETVTLALMRELKVRGHPCFAIVSGWNDGQYPAQLSEADIPHRSPKLGRLYLSKPRWTLDGLINLPGAGRELRQVIEEFRPDVLVLTGVEFALTVVHAVTKRVPLAIHLHDVPNRHWSSWLGGHVLRRSTGVVTVSDFIRERVLAVPRFGLPVRTVHNGLPPPSREVHRSYSAKLRIGIIGQLLPRKRHSVLVEAVVSSTLVCAMGSRCTSMVQTLRRMPR
jgi:hypothetical protein